MYEIERIDLLPQDITTTTSDLIFEIYIEDNVEFFIDVNDIDIEDDLSSGNREITDMVNIGEFDILLLNIADKFDIDVNNSIYKIYYSEENLEELNIFYMEVLDAKCKPVWC